MLPERVRCAYGIDPDDEVVKRTEGLINQTFQSGELIIQKLHPIFGPEVNLDIYALGEHLRKRGVSVPRLIPTSNGEKWVETKEGNWRALERLPGQSHDKVKSQEMAESAGRLLGRFHSALLDHHHTFSFARSGVHNTEAHLSNLRDAIQSHGDHQLYREVLALKKKLIEVWTSLPLQRQLPARIGHGDPKISNLLFEGSTATSLIDLDTMGWTTLDAEIGDAIRSWCNPSNEDEAPTFSLGCFEASIRGYLSQTPWITLEERASLVAGVLRIPLELSARFAADALQESYFGWSDQVAPTRGEHNLLRARGQLQLLEEILKVRPKLEELLDSFRPEENPFS